MRTTSRAASGKIVRIVGVAPLLLAAIASVQAQQTFTPKTIVQFKQGGDRERAMLGQMPGLANLVKGQFGVGAADLNGDGKAEMVLISLVCDAAGCPVVALQSAGPGKIAPIFAQRVAGRVAITNETVNGYNAFAAADTAGAIMKDGSGKPLVYPVGVPAGAAANAAPATPAAPPARAPAAATAPPAPAAASVAAGGEYLPMCTLPSCLNPRVVEKAGVGTANATARAVVAVEDATRWCAQNNPRYKYCAEDQVAQGGSGGAAQVRSAPYTAAANCQTGTLTAVDRRQYKYVGTWTDGPGAGRAKFGGGSGGVGTRVFEQQGGPQVANGSTSVGQVALDPNSGESLAIQWEILCKGAPPPAP